MIGKAWIEQKEIRSVMVFLQSHGVSSAYASKIYKRYGNESIAVVKENPYRLAHDIFGIGFLTADRIAQKLGFDEKSPLRAEAGIMFALHEMTDEGHVYVPIGELIAKSKEMLNIDETILDIAMKSLVAENKIVIEDLQTEDFIVHGVFLSGYHLAEKQIAKMLGNIRDSEKRIRNIEAEKSLEWVQGELSITLAGKQIEAVKAALINKFLVITGAPGTGKTTITKSILQIFSKVTTKIFLAAPTGRAAKRMSEATGMEAKTIHRLLEFDPAKVGFKKNEEYQLDCDLIILDEASMIDNLLMYHLLKAIPKHAVLILVGDVYQLPSVGAGNVLKDIINSKAFTVVELNEIFRQVQQSAIITNSHRIIHGEYPRIDNTETNTDFYFIHEEEQERVLDKLLLMVKERIPKKFGYDPISDIQILAPMNRGIVGTAKLNESLQNALNPSGFEIVRGGRKYRINDKIMQIRNNYDKEIFNGDIGIITNIDTEEQTVSVNIDGREISYEYSELDELVLAYAVSIHKSQGSEYPVVVIPLVMSHYMLLQRNLIYTGITRGKKLVIVVGSKKAMFLAVKNDKTMKRYTWLKNRIK